MSKYDGQQKSVALVVLDTLRKDAFDRHFEWLPGTRYDNAWSTSHWTVPAHASLFTGRYGSELGVHGKSKTFDCPEPALAELLTENGYTTRGLSCNIHVSKYFSFNRGFQEFQNPGFEEESEFNWAAWIQNHKYDGPQRYLTLLHDVIQSEANTLQTLWDGVQIKLSDLGVLSDDSVDKGALDVLDYVRELYISNNGEFLFLNLMEAHGPYNPPESYRTRPPQTLDGADATVLGSVENVEAIEAAYDSCVRYLSDMYEEIFSELAKKYDYVITVADHGEAFGEYDGWGHFSGLWPQVTNVPLVVSPTGHTVNKQPVPTDSPVSLLDVFQTICDCSGVDSPQHTRGKSLLEEHDREFHVIETHGLLTKDRDRLRNRGVERHVLDQYDELHHGVADTNGYTFEDFDGNLTEWHDSAVDARSRIDSFKKSIDERSSTQDADVPAHVQDRLKDLGYA